MDKYSCNSLNSSVVDDYSDIYTLTAVVEVHESPSNVDFTLESVLINGQLSIDELESGTSF
jgi:hypothetical protein